MVFRLSIAYMKEQKGRTIALIISVAIGVLMSFLLSVIGETKFKSEIDCAYHKFGDYHTSYSSLESRVIGKFKKDKSIEKLNDVLCMGEIVHKDGASVSLKSYDKDFLDSYSYKLTSGRAPVNTNEIIIEQKALEEMNLESKLNQEIDFSIVKEYVDEKNKNQIFSKDKRFKLVGIISKPNQYYDGQNDYLRVNAFTKSNDNEAILPNNLVSHSGVIYFSLGKPDFRINNEIVEKYNLSDENLCINIDLLTALEDYHKIKTEKISYLASIIPMLASSFVICNIFNMIFMNLLSQIGILMAIGLTKNKVRFMILIQGFVVLVVGTIVGFLLGILTVDLGFKFIYGTYAKVYISKDSILAPIIMAFLAVLISSLPLMFRIGRVSVVDAIKGNKETIKNKKNKFYYKWIGSIFGLTGIIAYKNIWRNKIRTILCIVSIGLAGEMVLVSMVGNKIENNSLDNTVMYVDMMGDNDIKLSNNYYNTNKSFVKYTEKDIKNISNLNNVKNVSRIMSADGFFSVYRDELTKIYKTDNLINNKSNNIEGRLEIEGHSNQGLKKLDKYIEKGSNIDNSKTHKHPQALVTNYFYSIHNSRSDNKILNKMNIGDLIDIKISVLNKGKLKYKEAKIEVAGILNGEYVLREGNIFDSMEIILEQDDFKKISLMDSYNKINLRIEKNSDQKVIPNIEKIIKHNPFGKMESKYEYKGFYIKQNERGNKVSLGMTVLMLIISFINILCIVNVNIITRTKEIATIRAIGMNIKSIRKMIIKENALYAIIGSLITGIVSSYEIYSRFGWKLEYSRLLIIGTVEFLIISVLISLIAVYLCKNKIEKISIVEGLNKNK